MSSGRAGIRRNPGRPDLMPAFEAATTCTPLGCAFVWHGSQDLSKEKLSGIGGTMMGRPPRQPVDLAAATKDIKLRIERVLVNLEPITEQRDPILADPRAVWLDVTLSIVESERVVVAVMAAPANRLTLAIVCSGASFHRPIGAERSAIPTTNSVSRTLKTLRATLVYLRS
jgi:hypothetical protein